jgi:polyisoprenoid-binding protein YceI
MGQKIKALPFLFAAILLLLTVNYCKKSDSIIELEGGVDVQSRAIFDASWILDKPHSNVNWESPYFDYSQTMLTGRFSIYGVPKFNINDSLNTVNLITWVKLSSFLTGEARDNPGDCGRSYLGVTYLDSIKTIVDQRSDTAWIKCNELIRSGTGLILKGIFSFNRYLPANSPTTGSSGDGQPIIKPISIYCTYNGMKDFVGTPSRYRAGFTFRFTFKRSDFLDINSTRQYVPVPKVADIAGNVIAASNKTYGVYSRSISDDVTVITNLQLYKLH